MSTAGRAAPEAALEPALPIVDAHHHLWDRPGGRYLLDEIRADVTAGHNIRATIYIESRAMSRPDGPAEYRCVGETEFANGIAAMSASGHYGACQVAAGIVTFADLEGGDTVGGVLDAHIQAGGGRLRGVRHAVYWDASQEVYQFLNTAPRKGLLSDPGFRQGVRQLARRSLNFDAILFHHQLPELAQLAQAIPDASIVLNHMGFPLGIGPYKGRRDEVFATWRSSMATLATCPNVTVKIGGMGVPLWGFEHQAAPSSVRLCEAWRPYAETTIGLFGCERCMFESNFPVDRAVCDYVTLWNALKLLSKAYTAGERTNLFSATAARVYRLALS